MSGKKAAAARGWGGKKNVKHDAGKGGGMLSEKLIEKAKTDRGQQGEIKLVSRIRTGWKSKQGPDGKRVPA